MSKKINRVETLLSTGLWYTKRQIRKYCRVGDVEKIVSELELMGVKIEWVLVGAMFGRPYTKYRMISK